MRLFEAEVGGVGGGSNRPPPQIAFQQRPQFMPSAVRASIPTQSSRGEIPPPPNYARPANLPPPPSSSTGAPRSGLSRAPFKPGQTEYCAAPQISKPSPDEDDDIMATLLKYEKEVKSEKRPSSSGTSDSKQGGPPKKMKPSAVTGPQLPQPKPAVKLGTQVTPEEIKQKAKQMVEMVKASQVIQSKRHPPTNHAAKAEKHGKKPKKMIRMAGGQMWEDSSLLQWDPNDFRLFCGDLGNDVTDEVLTRTFSKYTSFQQAKVVRDKRSNKTKGYGFVSFRDPADFTRAIKEMDGKYVGSRPIKLRKSNWKDRNIDQVKSKQKQKAVMGFKS